MPLNKILRRKKASFINVTRDLSYRVHSMQDVLYSTQGKGRIMDANTNEATRQRLLAIRARFRELLLEQVPLRNKAVFYSGTSSSLPKFCSWLGTKNPEYLGAQNLESLPAGAYLQSIAPELMAIFGTKDFDEVRTFALSGGTYFSGSINGMWRELSALFAKACSGVVHVLVTHERAKLHRASIEFWTKTRENSAFPKSLKVFGFVEFPILIGMLSHNSGVTAVNIYIETEPGHFCVTQGGSFVIAQQSGQA